MTKKHYKAIAEIIRNNKAKNVSAYRQNLISSLEYYFKSDNPNFSFSKFEDACK